MRLLLMIQLLISIGAFVSKEYKQKGCNLDFWEYDENGTQEYKIERLSKSFIKKTGFAMKGPLNLNKLRELQWLQKQLQKFVEEFQCVEIDFMKIGQDDNFVQNSVYRARWMLATLNSLINQIESKMKNKKLSFKQEAEQFFDCAIDEEYIDEKHINNAISKIQKSLEKQGSKINNEDDIYESFKAFREKFVIKKEDYQNIFSVYLKESQQNQKRLLKFQYKDIIQEKYYSDIKDPSEAYAEIVKKYESKICVNLERLISIEKLQQLAVHEGFHHLHFCMLEEIKQKFPEFKVIEQIDINPMGILMEGCAEAMVELYFRNIGRKEDLKFIVENMGQKGELSSELNLEILLDLEDQLNQLWRLYTLVAKQFFDQEISEEKAVEIMKNQGMKTQRQWPNVEFFRKFGAYNLGYGYGRYLILQFLEKIQLENQCDNGDIMDKFIQFIKYPVLPSDMQRYVNNNA